METKAKITITVFIISAILIGIGVYPKVPPFIPYIIDWLKTLEISNICLFIGVIGLISSIWYYLNIDINEL